MDFLDGLMGGEEQEEKKRGGKKKGGKHKGGKKKGGNRRDEYRDFAERYDKGAPYDGISDEEAVSRYGEIAPRMSENEYRESAREAFSRMSPEERMQFGQQLQGQAREQGRGDFIDRNHDGQDDRFQDPDYLANLTGRMQSQQPDMMGQLLGGMMGGGGGGSMGGSGSIGGAGGMLGGLMGGSGTAGGGSGGGGGMMGNPVAKAAMAGIAAMAVKKMMGNR